MARCALLAGALCGLVLKYAYSAGSYSRSRLRTLVAYRTINALPYRGSPKLTSKIAIGAALAGVDILLVLIHSLWTGIANTYGLGWQARVAGQRAAVLPNRTRGHEVGETEKRETQQSWPGGCCLHS
jgi:hypothetical protein